MGPLAIAVAARAKRRQRFLPESHDWKSGLVADLKHALRAIKLNRSFSAIVVLTLAIGIGACTAVFSIVNALLLGSLPYPNPEQLTLVWETEGDDREERYIVAQPVYEDWKKETRSFSSMGIWEYRTYNVSSAEEPEQVQGVRASASLFRTLGVSPALGRVFTPEEEAPGHRVVVISDSVWRNHLGAQASAIGSTIRLNDQPFEVIGVMPKGFEFPWRRNGVWVPFAIERQDTERGAHSFWVAARMKPEVTFEQARADVEQVGLALRQRFEQNRDEGSTLTLMADQGIGTLRTMLTVLMGAVTLVLIIGCVNVANLQLGRALTRRREFALRLALGAGIWRLARQLFAESVMLAAAGGIGGLALAWATTRAADLVLTPGFRALPFRGEVPITIDARVLLFAAAAALVSAALFGFTPLLSLRRSQSAPSASRRRTRLDRRRQRGPAIACGHRSRARDRRPVRRRPLDQEPVGTAADQPGPRSPRSADPAGLAAPGGHLWAAGPRIVLRGSLARRGGIAGDPFDWGDQSSAVERQQCGPGTDGRRLYAKAGRKRIGVVPAHVSRIFRDARHFDDRRTGLQSSRRHQRRSRRHRQPHDGGGVLEERRESGRPAAQARRAAQRKSVAHDRRRHRKRPAFRARFRGAPRDLHALQPGRMADDDGRREDGWRADRVAIGARETSFDACDADLPVARVQSMEEVVGSSLNWRETPMRLLTGFAAIGLLLASIGVYGVLAYYVSQRTREIGVRAALGATRRQLAGLVVRQSMLPIGAGVIIGVAGSLASGRLLQQFLFQVQPGDPQVIATIVLLLIGVGLLASWLPARRAAAIDPLVSFTR